MPDGEARRAAAAQLQSVFLVQLLRAMRRTIPENDFLPRAPSRDVYEGLFDRAVADTLAAGDPLGLVRRLDPGGPSGPSSPGATLPITAVERKDGAER
jgi:Rod binding domain-containing protein